MKKDLAPLRNVFKKPWEGNCEIKPWDYRVSAVIPCLDTAEQVEICVRLLQLQTLKPYIVIVDTGSSEEEFKRIESLRADDIEVHAIRLNGVLHPSDFPAMAMDLAFSVCRSPYLFATHADCFLRRQDFLKDLVHWASTISPVVGYEISPRNHSDWKGMVSHTATMYQMSVMDRINFGWSMRRLCNYYNIKDQRPTLSRPNWPDTEILGNYQLRSFKIKPHLIGSEQNFERKIDENIDHFRSFTSGKLYSPDYYKMANKWYLDAKKEALERIAKWEQAKNDNRRSI
jgi:hypothetical protein